MLILYGTEGCHLCHDAQEVLKRAGVSWQDVDIVDHDDLLSRYETRIPVLSQAGRELDWPFQPDDVQQWLATLANGSR